MTTNYPSGGAGGDGPYATGVVSEGRSRGAHALDDDPTDIREPGEDTARGRVFGSGGNRRRDRPDDIHEPDSDVDDGESLGPPTSRLDDDDDRRRITWHGGHDIAMLALRVTLGCVFVVRGAQKVLNVPNGQEIGAFASYLTEAGFRESTLLAWGAGITELLAGALLVIGLFTPIAAAALLTVMINAILVNWSDGFLLPGGVEYQVALATMAFMALFAGPGRVALDYRFGWFRRQLLSAFVFLIIAAGAAATVEVVLR
jgi:putative oxidoreductase